MSDLQAPQKVAPTRFVIWFEERSGSSHLVSLLNSHREIKCRGEVFAFNQVDSAKQTSKEPYFNFDGMLCRRRLCRFPGILLDPSRQQAMDMLWEWYNDRRKIQGFKFKHPIQAALYPEVDEQLRRWKDELKIVVLHRKNLLKRVVSRLNMIRFRQDFGISNARSNLGPVEQISPINVDVSATVAAIRRLRVQQTSFQAWYATYPQVLHIEYEDLLYDRDRVCQELQQFLHVKVVRPLRSKVKKISSDQLDIAVANYEELRQALIADDLCQYVA